MTQKLMQILKHTKVDIELKKLEELRTISFYSSAKGH